MFRTVNKPVKRLDAMEKVTGQAKFSADLNWQGQLYAQTVYAEHPHARILTIDTAAAECAPKVAAVITYKDVPGPNFMFGRFPVLAGDMVRYIGEGVAVVAARTPQAARLAAKLVKVSYQPLAGVYSMAEAVAEKAPLVHGDRPGNQIESAHLPLAFGRY